MNSVDVLHGLSPHADKTLRQGYEGNQESRETRKWTEGRDPRVCYQVNYHGKPLELNSPWDSERLC